MLITFLSVTVTLFLLKHFLKFLALDEDYYLIIENSNSYKILRKNIKLFIIYKTKIVFTPWLPSQSFILFNCNRTKTIKTDYCDFDVKYINLFEYYFNYQDDTLNSILSSDEIRMLNLVTRTKMQKLFDSISHLRTFNLIYEFKLKEIEVSLNHILKFYNKYGIEITVNYESMKEKFLLMR